MVLVQNVNLTKLDGIEMRALPAESKSSNLETFVEETNETQMSPS